MIPAIIILIVDQLTKYLVQTNLAYGAIWSPWPWLTPYARIIHWTNTGVAFGMFQGMGWIFSIFAVAITVAIIYYFPTVAKEDWAIRVALVLEMAGALGNMIDRIRINGAVLDFISVGNFAVFNVADSAITTGVLSLLIFQRQFFKTQHESPVEKNTAMTEDVSSDLADNNLKADE